MPAKKYRVKLTEAERQELKELLNKGRIAARKQTHARILLQCDESGALPVKTDQAIAEALNTSTRSIERVRQRFVEEGLESALNPKPQARHRAKKLDGAAEAFLVATACMGAPEGQAKWTMQLLADKLVECNIVDSISDETVRLTLKKNALKPWLKECWCIPPQANADFVCAMEDVLEVYQRTYADDEVLVCMDETSKQHIKETRTPLPTRPGEPEKYDFEYERNGVSNLFMLSAPLEGWRHVKVTDHHAKVDWARLIKELVDEHFPEKKKIVLVMDNLNTHKLGSLYAAFKPEEARRIAERLEIHYTPRQGSWLNMAEIEIGVMARQCLDRRIPDQETLRHELKAWQDKRNQAGVCVNWRFTTQDARVKLKSLYPAI